MDVVTDTICASEAFFAYVSSHGELGENLRAIRPSDRLAGWDSHPLEIAAFHGVLGFETRCPVLRPHGCVRPSDRVAG
jgi:hypothetical protein